jgi:chemotaxis protein MotB
MFKKITISVVVLALSTSCVSKKIYNDLESKFANLKKENRHLADTNDSIAKLKNQLDLDHNKLTTNYNKTKDERDQLLSDYTNASKNLKTLQDAYKALEKNSSESLQANLTKSTCRRTRPF